MTAPLPDRIEIAASLGARGWISRGTWAIADQGFFASGNFLLSVLLARWLSGAEYGAFVLAFFLFLFLATLHNGLLIEPMLVFGPSEYRSRHPMYRSAMLKLHMLSCLPLTAVLLLGAGIAWWFGNQPLAGALAVLAPTGPAILLLWLMRRMCYLDSAPHRAAMAGVLYLVLLLGSLFVVQHHDHLGIVSALLIQGGCSLICAGGLLVSERVRWPHRDEKQAVHEVFTRHLRYSRWASAGGLAGFLPAQAYYLLLPILVSTQAAGVFRGLINPILPLQQAVAAMGIMLLPRLSAQFGTHAFYRTVRWAVTTIVAGAIAYWLLCGIFHQQLIHLLYADGDGDGEFTRDAWMLWIIGLQPVLQAVTSVYGAAVVATQRPDRYFYAQLASSIVALTLGVALAMRLGVIGASIAVLINLLVQAIMLIRYTHKRAVPLADNSSVPDRYLPVTPEVRS